MKLSNVPHFFESASPIALVGHAHDVLSPFHVQDVVLIPCHPHHYIPTHFPVDLLTYASSDSEELHQLMIKRICFGINVGNDHAQGQCRNGPAVDGTDCLDYIVRETRFKYLKDPSCKALPVITGKLRGVNTASRDRIINVITTRIIFICKPYHTGKTFFDISDRLHLRGDTFYFEMKSSWYPNISDDIIGDSVLAGLCVEPPEASFMLKDSEYRHYPARGVIAQKEPSIRFDDQQVVAKLGILGPVMKITARNKKNYGMISKLLQTSTPICNLPQILGISFSRESGRKRLGVLLEFKNEEDFNKAEEKLIKLFPRLKVLQSAKARATTSSSYL